MSADWEAIIVEKVGDLNDGIKDFRDEMRGDLKIQRHETAQGFRAVNERLTDHGERITAVETKVTGLIPKIDAAAQKANGATTAVAGLSGKWSTGWKVLATILTGAALGTLGYFLRSLIGN